MVSIHLDTYIYRRKRFSCRALITMMMTTRDGFSVSAAMFDLHFLSNSIKESLCRSTKERETTLSLIHSAELDRIITSVARMKIP
jgi:hypothetical protein